MSSFAGRVQGADPIEGPIIFAGGAGPGSTQLYSLDPGSGVETRLTDLKSGVSQPALSSDGKRIAAIVRVEVDELWVMGSDGSNPRSLTPEAKVSPAGATAFYLAAKDSPARPLFHRGDPNGDGVADITDAVFLLGFLYLGGGAPPCMESADVDNNTSTEITDAIYLLSFLFLGGPPPADPGPPAAPCGVDPDAIGSRSGFLMPQSPGAVRRLRSPGQRTRPRSGRQGAPPARGCRRP